MDKRERSAAWLKQGDAVAFDHSQWEFMSRCFFLATERHLAHGLSDPSLEWIATQPVAQFTIAIAVELIAKAHYLKAGSGNPRRVYTHEISSLLPDGLLDQAQQELLSRSVSIVVWAGRYPTPRWNEQGKAEWNVPIMEDGSINVAAMPNAGSVDQIRSLQMLYLHIREAWVHLADGAQGPTTGDGPN